MLMKILRYELKRIRLGRLYPIMLLCNIVYACIWMWQIGLSGVGGTAPFSKWTYLAYCGAMLPAAVLSLLLSQANFFSEKQQKADILPLSSPYTAGELMLIRITALLICFLIIFLAEYLLFAIPFALFFGTAGVLGYPLIGLIHMLPTVILMLTLGCLIGKIRGWLIYVLAAVTFITGLAQFSVPFDLFGNKFFSEYPLKLPTGSAGEPAFEIVPLWICSRIVFFAVGAVILLLSVRRNRKPTLDRAEN